MLIDSDAITLTRRELPQIIALNIRFSAILRFAVEKISRKFGLISQFIYLIYLPERVLRFNKKKIRQCRGVEFFFDFTFICSFIPIAMELDEERDGNEAQRI